jgi:polyphosphate glucokinase
MVAEKKTAAERAKAAAAESVNQVVANSMPADTSANGKSSAISVLAIDVGGTKVKMLATGKTEPRKSPTGLGFTPERLLELIKSIEAEWPFNAVTIGFPGLVGPDGPKSEPGNLGPGWVGFDFASAIGKPVKIVNDAVMQALGSYDNGRMVFMGFGTGIGSALIADHLIVPLELSHLRYNDRYTIADLLSRKALARIGKRAFRRVVDDIVPMLLRAFVADYVVLGGGNAKIIKKLPLGARMGHNNAAFRGGFRLWETDHDWLLAASSAASVQTETPVRRKKKVARRRK